MQPMLFLAQVGELGAAQGVEAAPARQATSALQAAGTPTAVRTCAAAAGTAFSDGRLFDERSAIGHGVGRIVDRGQPGA